MRYNMLGSIAYTIGAIALSCLAADFAFASTASIHAVSVSHQFHRFILD